MMKMNPKTKVAVNTIVLYIRVLISMAISLITVPILLNAMGASDYGLVNLVAGLVGMLSFLNASLTVSSQRYMSVAMGAGDVKRIEIVYNTSFLLHLLLGFFIVLGLEIGAFFIHLLNIEPDRLWCAQIIYQFFIISTFTKIVSVPFDALTNAHEDLIVFSVIELVDSLFMLTVALSIKYSPIDKLLFYGLGILAMALLNIALKYGWVRFSYNKYRIRLRKNWKELQTKNMFGFAGWNLFGGVALMCRNQGVAIIINVFMGTIANAAYGIANQINGALSNFSGTFQKAINPQLMKSEGMNDRGRLLRISFLSSKFSVLALSFFAVPLIIEMTDVLTIWLNDAIPPFTIELSRYILLLTIVYQYSAGIMSSIQAVGNIRQYQLTMGSIILLNIPMAFFILKMGFPVYYVTLCYVFLEIISLIVRIIMAKRLVNMPPSAFISNVIKPTAFIILPAVLLCLIPHYLITNLWGRIIVTCIVFAITYLLLLWYVGLDDMLRDGILKKLKAKK